MNESVLAEAKRDENGVPILKGYRPPFKKGYDSRRYKGSVRYRMITMADARRLFAKCETVIDLLTRKRKKPIKTVEQVATKPLNSTPRKAMRKPPAPDVQSGSESLTQVKPEPSAGIAPNQGISPVAPESKPV